LVQAQKQLVVPFAAARKNTASVLTPELPDSVQYVVSAA